MLPEAPNWDADRRSTGALGPSIDTSGPSGPAAGRPTGPGLVNTQQSARGNCVSLQNTVEARNQRRAARCARRTITRSRLFDESLRKGGYRGRWLMVTPTYRPDVDWRPSHLRHCLHAMREWGRRCGVKLRYTWVMELTKRGRPHYHLLVFMPRHLHLPKMDKRGWWPHGSTKTEVARNAVGYLAKYASKAFGACDPDTGDEYLFPRGARICGGTAVDGGQLPEWRYWAAPKWARDRVQPLTDLRRDVGGYFAPDTGEFFGSPWRYLGMSPDRKQLLFEYIEESR